MTKIVELAASAREMRANEVKTRFAETAVFIEVEPQRLLVASGASLVVNGQLHNRGASVISFEASDVVLAFGGRLTTDASDSSVAVVEGRAILAAPRLDPAASSSFSLTVRTLGVKPGRYVLQLNLVAEGHFWWTELGHAPLRLEVEVAASAPYGRQYWNAQEVVAALPEGGARSARELCRAIVSKFDYSTTELFQRIQRKDGPLRFIPPEMIRAATVSEEACDPKSAELFGLDEPDPRATGFELSPYMLHVRHMLKLESRWHLESRKNKIQFLFWYAFEAPVEHPDIAFPLSRAAIEFLNAPLLPHWLDRLECSNAMGRSLGQFGELDQYLQGGGEDALGWWWVTSYLPNARPGVDVVPERVLRSLLHDERALDMAGQPGISGFCARAHQASSAYQQRYKLHDEVDRAAFHFDLILNNLQNSLNLALISPAYRRLFGQSVEPGASGPTLFEALCAAYGFQARADDRPTSAADATSLWFRDAFCAAYPWMAPLASASPSTGGNRVLAGVAKPSLRIIGLTQGSSGLSENLRMAVSALESSSIAVEVCDCFTAQTVRRKADSEAAPKQPLVLKRDLDLFQVNADLVPRFMAMDAVIGNKERRRSAVRVGFFLWELETLPESHRWGAASVDEIWVPTQFLKDAYEKFSDRPVHVMGKGMRVPETPGAFSWAKYGIPEGNFVFLCSFDFGSGLERKNPLAAVRAFRQAFPATQKDVSLVIRTTRFERGHWGDPADQWGQINEIATRDPRIKVVESMLERNDYFAMIAAADCVVSPHRGEGFGYLAAEALSYSRPLIVTNYSGTVDFCTPENSTPVGYAMKRVRDSEFIYPLSGARWAEIDVEELAAAMQWHREHTTEARAKAAVGQKQVRELYSLEAMSHRYTNRLKTIGAI